MTSVGEEKVFLISLGCVKNLVDSEHILGTLSSNGFALASMLDEADIAIVNTCGFLQTAVEEAIDTILEVADLKKHGKLRKLVVVGCLVQRFGYRLKREIPEVDGWLGPGEIYRIADLVCTDSPRNAPPFFIGRPSYLADHTAPRIRSTPFYTAYLRIAEGCSHGCTYCLIPRLRGPLRSRNIDSLVAETEEMVANGVKEFNVVAQDTTMYGKDLEEDVYLEALLERLVAIRGVEWIRLLYCHPEGISDRLLELIQTEEIICPYLDIPFQHVHRGILRAMGREPRGESPLELVERIRSGRRRISLRTTLMVGFPGESDEIFLDLLDFVKVARFDHLGVFVFSREKGTAAARFKPVVEPAVGRQRLDEIMALQAEISKDLNQRMVGHVVPTLIEGQHPESDFLLTGRSATMAPDVDTQILINKGTAAAGEITPVLINEAHAYDLIGEIKE